jgi:GTP-binding protein
VNKIDRPDARIAEVIDEVYELFLDLDAEEHHIEFPIVYTVAREGTATIDLDVPGTDMSPLFDVLLEHVPAPVYDTDHPMRAWVTNLDASPYVGRIAVCRVEHGTITRGSTIAWCKADGTVAAAKIGTLQVTESLDRIDVDEAGPGEIIGISGIPEVTIGETLADLDDPRPFPAITVDEPTLSMTIGANTSPLAGKEGSKVTARQIKDRLDKELVGNVSIRVLDTDRPDTWEVQGRGELQLAILIESMRREGFELTVGKPEVVTREIDDKVHEPTERLTIDVPEEHVGAVTGLLGERKGRLETMTNHGTGWVRLDYVVPARALIGFRTEFLTETRGTGMLHHIFEGWTPWMGELRMRPNGAVVADRTGQTTGYAIQLLQERTSLYVGPGVAVYEGMIVGENARSEDMDVNIVREKQLTNMRTSSSDDTIRLTPPKLLSLEQALETIGDDECAEVTPSVVRLRKVLLTGTDRARVAKAKKNARESAS